MSAPRRFGTLRGIFLLATWRGEGIANFADTRQAFLNSLAPLLALPLVGFLLLAAQGQFVAAFSNLLLAVVVLLGPLLASQAIARWWRRDGGWYRFATALNWCQWGITAVAMLMLFMVGLAINTGLSQRGGTLLLALGCIVYAVSVQSLIARAGLGMSAARAIGFVLLFNTSAAMLILVPALVRAILSNNPGGGV